MAENFDFIKKAQKKKETAKRIQFTIPDPIGSSFFCF
jgi:hypothetical protein